MRNPMVLDLMAGIGEFFPRYLAFCLCRKERLVILPNDRSQPRSQSGQSGDQSQGALFQFPPDRAEFRFGVHGWLLQEEPAGVSGQRLLTNSNPFYRLDAVFQNPCRQFVRTATMRKSRGTG
jgi:hypothetical protein